MSQKMPDGYRYASVCVDMGTGMGDDVYSLGLQKFETRSVVRGIWPFRRTVQVTRWWTVETFGFGPPGPDQYAKARHSAWTRYHNETGGANA